MDNTINMVRIKCNKFIVSYNWYDPWNNISNSDKWMWNRSSKNLGCVNGYLINGYFTYDTYRIPMDSVWVYLNAITVIKLILSRQILMDIINLPML